MKNIERYYEFYDHGCTADAETVVFLPGVACSTWMFRDAVPIFNPKYKVLIINNPGTNGTNVPLNLTVEKIANIVKNVLEFLNINACHLVGHSMGGFTSQTLSKTCSERIRKMILVSSSCGGSFTKKERVRLIKDLGPNFWKRRRDFNDKPEDGINYSFSDAFIKNEPVKYKMFAHRFFEMRPKHFSIVKHFICAGRFSSEPYLNEIQTPTLIIHGKDDKLIISEAARILNEKISDSKIVFYSDCGHFPMIENENFYQDVLKFIQT